MAYGKYGYDTKNYGHGVTEASAESPNHGAATTSLSKAMREAIDRIVRGATKDDKDARAFEDGPVPGSATAQD
jgi:hypothetical protein